MATAYKKGETDYQRTARALNDYASKGDKASYNNAVNYANSKGWGGMVPSTSPFATPAVRTPTPGTSPSSRGSSGGGGRSSFPLADAIREAIKRGYSSNNPAPSNVVNDIVNRIGRGTTNPSTGIGSVVKPAPGQSNPVLQPQGAGVSTLIKALAANPKRSPGYGMDIRSWSSQQGFGDVGWDPQASQILLGGKMFNLGAIPGTILDAETGKHIITDEETLMNSLSGQMGNQNLMNTDALYQQLLEELNRPQPTMEEMWEQIQQYMPEYQPAPVLGYDEAIMRAQSQINPLYELSTKDLLDKLANDQISRGFFGQLPVADINAQAVANLEAQKNAEIAGMANDLVGQSQENALAQEQLNLQRSSQSLNALINMLTNSQNAANSRRDGILGIANSLDKNSQFSQGLDLQKQEMELSREELQAKQELEQMNAALNRTELLGYVLPQDSSILGVAAGTASWKAKEAALDRQNQLTIASMRSSGESAANKKEREATVLKQQVQNVQAKYGCNQATAVAILGVWDNPTRVSAVADIEAEKAGFEKQGISGDIIMRALDDKWKAPEYSWLDKPQYISSR